MVYSLTKFRQRDKLRNSYSKTLKNILANLYWYEICRKIKIHLCQSCFSVVIVPELIFYFI